MRYISFILIIVFLTLTGVSFAETQEYEFAKAYILGINARKQIEDRSNSDLREAGTDEMKKNMALMRNANRAKLELQAAINSLSEYSESKNEALRNATTYLVKNYEALIKNYSDMLQILEIMNNPANASNSNVDLGKMMNETSKLTAMNEYISESLFQASTLATAALVDLKPDKDGHCSYLLLTSEERKDLISDLDMEFGEGIKDGPKAGQSYTLASAAMMRKLLTGDHKNSDERK